MDDDSSDIRTQPSVVSRFFIRISQDYQRLLDYFTPHLAVRWISTVALGILYMMRVIYVQGFYIVTYALGIYHLNLFIAFLTPKIDPALNFDSDDDEDGPSLPTKQAEEFKPFMRRLPEFKFWYSATKGIFVAFVCTFFQFFDIPVFWPILVVYFFILFILTMKRQIRHMIKYRYMPFTSGKRRYAGREDSGKVVQTAPTVPGQMLVT